MLKLENINLTYLSRHAETEALSNLNFTIKEGEFVSLVGPSGCGKTTILSLIAGLIKATSGRITLAGEVITKPTTRVGYMFQRDNLFEWLTIMSNITLGQKIQHKYTSANLNKAEELIKKYGLKIIFYIIYFE